MVSHKLASALKKAKNLGRNGDTMLAHINPDEATILKKLGGSGTINPHTGLPQFDNPSMGSYDGAGDTSGNADTSGWGGSSSGGGGGGGSSNYSNYIGGSDLGGYSGSGNTTYSGGGSTSYRTAGAIDAATNNYGDAWNGIPSADSIRSSAQSDWNPMGPAGLSGSAIRAGLDGANGLANAISAGAGQVKDAFSSLGDSLLSFSDAAQPQVNAWGQKVSNGLQTGADSLYSGFGSLAESAKSMLDKAMSSETPSYTQMASGGVGGVGSDYAMPLMGPPGLRSEAANGGYEPPSSFPSMVPSIKPDYNDPNSYIGGGRLGGYEGSGNTVYSGFGNLNDTPAPTRAPMRQYLDRQYAAPDATISGVGYSGPKGVNAPIDGVMPHLNQAAYEAGGGLTLDPAAVARISGKLGYTPIGLRTNNPGNIFDGKFAQGLPGYIGPTTSKNGLTYATFTSPEYGVNAIESLISGPSYYGAGRTSINDIINRYAPVDQNNSAAANAGYKNYIAKELGVSKDAPLTQEQLGQMARAQVAYENGGDPLVQSTPSTMYAYNGQSTQPVIRDVPVEQPTASQSVQVASNEPIAPQAPASQFPTQYEVDGKKLVADIRANNWGSGIYSDQSLIDKVIASNPESISYDQGTGKLTVNLGDANGDGTINQSDYDNVLASFKEQAKVDASGYTVPLGPPTQTNVAANPIMANMGIAQPPESPDLPSYNAVVAGDSQSMGLPSRPITPTPSWAYGSDMVNPSVYTSPLTLPAQPTQGLSTAINTAIGGIPGIGIINTIAGLFDSSAGDMIANRENYPVSPEDAANQQVASFGGSGGDGGRSSTSNDFRSIVDTSKRLDSAKTKADQGWQTAAKNFGFTDSQLKDKNTSALIKELFDLGFFA
jgi:hypothetical protein